MWPAPPRLAMLGVMDSRIDVVTGGFGNAGGAVVRRLQAAGRTVRTLTNHPPEDPGDIEVHPLAFDDPDRLAAALDGAATFYNTYWVRMGDRGNYDRAVANSKALVDAATRAGVSRIVQFSVIKPSLDSPFPYFRGKAQVEAIVRDSGIPAAIIRPALIFGGDAVLIHNLAWLLRRMPVFAIPGDGDYRVRPVHVDDIAELCVAAGARSTDETVDAVGPERPTFNEFVTTLRDAVGGRARIVHAPSRLVLAGARVLGAVLRDDLLNRDELNSTMAGLADSDAPAIGSVVLSAWIREHAGELGRRRPGHS
jgi:NADH dehydrogenase